MILPSMGWVHSHPTFIRKLIQRFIQTKQQDLLEVFFESLAIRDLTTEPKYWCYIVANEIPSNPLFKDTVEPLAALNNGVNADLPDAREVRFSLLRGRSRSCCFP
jgi:hypothetical protein